MSVASTPPREYKKERTIGYNLLTTSEKKFLSREVEFYKEKLRKAETKEDKQRYYQYVSGFLRELKAHSSTYRSDCITAR